MHVVVYVVLFMKYDFGGLQGDILEIIQVGTVL